MKRLTITWTVEFGGDQDDPPQPEGDVFASTERRPSEDHDVPNIGFGRPE